MLRFSIAGHFEEVVVRQLSKFGPAPKQQNHEKAWHQIEEQQVEVNWLNKEPDNLTNQETGQTWQKLSWESTLTSGHRVSSKCPPRLKHYVVALVHRAQVDGVLYRKGAVTTVLPGAQSLERAWYYGLRLMAHYLDLSKKVVVQVLSVRAWEGWMKHKHREVFHDLSNLVMHDQRSRIQPMSCLLYTSPSPRDA